MSVSLLTVHCSKNPGASLQAHALSKKLTQYTDDLTLIDYCPIYFLDPMDPRKRACRSGKDAVKELLIGRAMKERFRLFQEFQQEYLPRKTRRFDSPQELKEAHWDSTHYVCGSDQIWNPDNVKYDTSFFFDFLPSSGGKKIAYAASIGQDRLEGRGLDYLKNGISQMDHVSVRERSGLELAQSLGFDRAQQHIDPTLLYPGSYWRTLGRAPERKLPEKYVLFYPIHSSDLSGKLIAAMKKRYGLPCVSIDGGVKKGKNVDIQIRAYGPREFLWLIDHAEHVITNSFHGLVLSLLLGKRVSVYRHMTRNSRLADVLAMLELSELQTDSVEAALALDWDEVDAKLAQVDARLRPERQRAEEYLAQALKGADV